jgi:hypothetical protein
MAKWVYGFGNGAAEGRAEMKDLLGGKGANLAEMSNLGLPVPPGFTITTDVCTHYYAHAKQYPKDLKAQVDKALAQVGRIAGKGFGDKVNPLLVSVRSGGRASMPGMMDTVLNLGLNDETVEALAKKSGDRRFAYDSYRRFITMYSDVVLADLGVEVGWRAAVLQVVAAGVGGDGEAGRHGQAQVRHLRQVGSLATQQVLLLLAALAEVVDPLGGRSAGHR